MFKLILLNQNLESIKVLCNCILNEIPDVQLSGICTSIEEFDELFTKVNPDIILMNYSDYISSKYSNKSEFKKLRIIFYDTPHKSKNSSKQVFISTRASLTEIKNSISKLVANENIRLVRKKIIKWLEAFQFDFKLIGTTYLVECILYCYENKSDYVFENLEKNVYPQVAKICHNSLKHVKWSVTRAVKNMNSHMNASVQKQLSNIFSLDFSEKITTKPLINTIVAKLN